MEVNRLILGDNLEILKTIDSDSIDLIYLDPPFFSNRNYEVIWGDAVEVRSFFCIAIGTPMLTSELKFWIKYSV
jgi:DNA modification methylase